MKAILSLMIAAAGAAIVSAQSTTDAAVAERSRQGIIALDRYLETWNSRDGKIWATSLHFPHVRPGPGAFELFQSAEQYAAGVNFQQTLSTGWHHSEWVTRTVLQVGVDKVHIAGAWQRYTADDRALGGISAITYIVTKHGDRWGVQSRFAAGVGTVPAEEAARNNAAALQAVTTFMQAWNGHDPKSLAAAIHYPHIRIADGQVEAWNSPEAFLAGADVGRQRTWYHTRLDSAKAVQTTANGVNVTVTFSHIARDGKVLSSDEGVFLVALRDGLWKVQARSTMGS